MQPAQSLTLTAGLILATLMAGTNALGRECCCDRYTQFSLPNQEGIVASCKALWADVAAGRSNEDYCNSVFCIQQTSDPWAAGKCGVAGYQCGDCSTGNVGCLG
ncbi:MAG: hypothetical protein M1825_004674 [Sarcosagium campestre]|nr:MAG: hypothetical protein M1825_004674 [Sarcosagium campestre]